MTIQRSRPVAPLNEFLSTGRHKTVTFCARPIYASTMIARFVLLVTLSLSVPTLAHAKMSDVSCDDRARMLSMLTDVLGAERQGMGLRDPETMLEVWVSRQDGEWMIVQNYANGTSCIVAMGEHWEAQLAGPA